MKRRPSPTAIESEIIGALALLGLIFFRKAFEFPKYFSLLILVFTLIAIVLFSRTAYLGGHIRHTEIRSDFQTQGYPDINIRKEKTVKKIR